MTEASGSAAGLSPAPALRWLVVAAAAAGLMLWGYLRWRATRVAFDDAYISFRYAHNLIAGHGLVFNPGERVEGYTNFLWTLLAAAGMALGWDPLATTRAVGVLAYLLAIALGVWAVGARARRMREVVLLALFALLVLPPTYPAFAGTGLETAFVGLLLLATGLVQQLYQPDPGWRRWLAGGLPMLAALTRPDAAVAVVASALVMMMAARGQRLRARLLPGVIPTVVAVGLHLAWRLRCYGGLLPNTYYAKGANLWSVGVGIEYLFAFAWSCPSSLLLLGLTAFAAFACEDDRCRSFARYAGLLVLAQILFIVKVGGDFMEYRMLWEVWPVLVPAGALGALALARRSLTAALVCAAAALALGRAPIELEMHNYMQSVQEMGAIAQRTRRVGPVLDAGLPPGTVIATTAAGMAYYAPDLRVVDQWGLNDWGIAHLPVARIVYRGHVKLAPRSYLAARGVNLVFNHPKLWKCSNPPRQNRAQVFIRLDRPGAAESDDTCVRADYLTQTPSLDAYLCAHPERFVLNRVACPEEKAGRTP